MRPLAPDPHRRNLVKANPLKVIAAGHSHICALRDGYFVDRPSDLDVDFVDLLSEEYRTIDGLDDTATIGERVNGPAADYDAIVLSISGNEHQMLGLVRSERPFDFAWSDGPYSQMLDYLEPVPSGLIYETVDAIMNRAIYDLFAGVRDRPVYQVEAPPPFLDEDYIRTYAGVLAPKIEEHGIAEMSVRHKLWQVQCAIMRKRADEAGFIYVANPPEVCGPEGFLHYLAYAGDAAHGNSWYGSLVMRKLRDLLLEGKHQ